MSNELPKQCSTCAHRVEQQLPPPELGKQAMCFLLPPVPFPILAQDRTGRPLVVGRVQMRPAVADADTCAQWEARPALIAPAANE